jgi:hypothetical protein
VRTSGILFRGLAVALLGYAALAITPPKAEASTSCYACGYHATCDDDEVCGIQCGSSACVDSCERSSSECGGESRYLCAACETR